MTLTLSARIDGPLIRCEIGSDTALPGPVFCFSLMAPARVEDGGTLLRSLGGYSEVQLPDIAPGQPAQLTLAQADPAFRPANRAWLPLGPYLRLPDGQTLPLPALPAGVTVTAPTPVEPFDGLRLVPPPESWTPVAGVLVATTFTGTFAGRGEPLAAVAALAARNGLGPFLAQDGAPLETIHDADLPDDAYTLDIAPQGVRLAASGRGGLFNGAITLLSLAVTHHGQIPCGRIADAPRFGWRGQHLDCARHFYAPATILRLLDLMALLKLNRFHWHFADDEAFRLQVDSAPTLWQQTAERGEGCALPGLFGGGVRSGGSYSRADVQAIVAHAKALNIEILPEIEVPAHALALNTVVPDLRDPDDTGTETSVQGYPGNVVNPAMPATWALLEPLAAEVAALFPFGMLHLGCDELPPGTWEGSPAVDALKAREGLATRDDVQGWTMARLAAGLAAQGIRVAAWEEAARGCQGGIGHDAVLFSWSGQGPGIAAARAGHDVVMCPAQHVYLDMAHTGDTDDWGASWAAFVALEDTLDWSPVPAGAEDIASRVIGVQGAFWSEFTTDDAQIEPMLAPRILGVATRAWDRSGAIDGAALRRLAGHYRDLFDAIGWTWNRAA